MATRPVSHGGFFGFIRLKPVASEDKGSISTEFQPRFGKPTSPPKGDWFQIRNRIPHLRIFALLSFGCLNKQQSEGMACLHYYLLKQKQYHKVKLKK